MHKYTTGCSKSRSKASRFEVCALALTLLAGCQKQPANRVADSTPSSSLPAEVALEQVNLAKRISLSVGVVPQQAASTLAKQWMPLLRHVSQQANVELVFKTASDIPTFEQRCAAGEYDIAYMNPYHYTIFHDQAGYEAMAKRSGSKIKGILVKKRGSDIQSLKDLEGAKLAFPAPRAFAATLLTTAGLQAAGVDFKSSYVSSHGSVYLNIAQGRYPAGGGIVRTFNSISSELRDQLEILWETPEYTPHAFAVHPRVDAKTKAAVTQALVDLSNSEDGRELLGQLKIKKLEVAADQDWDDVRRLHIQIR